MSDYSETDKKQDLAILHSMGYAQELERRMSSFSNFAISFSIICILSGASIRSRRRRPARLAAIGIGWPLGCVISGVFALAMAQISSAYPTAGGLYHWGSILGTASRLGDGLVQPACLVVTVLGAINAAPGASSRVRSVRGSASMLMQRPPPLCQPIIFVALITALQALINHFGIKLTAKLTDMSGYLIFVTAIALTLVCFFGAALGISSRLWTFTTIPASPTLLPYGRRVTASGTFSRSACCCRSTRSPL